LPDDPRLRAKLRELHEFELAAKQGLDLDLYAEDDTLIFWWD